MNENPYDMRNFVMCSANQKKKWKRFHIRIFVFKFRLSFTHSLSSKWDFMAEIIRSYLNKRCVRVVSDGYLLLWKVLKRFAN